MRFHVLVILAQTANEARPAVVVFAFFFARIHGFSAFFGLSAVLHAFDGRGATARVRPPSGSPLLIRRLLDSPGKVRLWLRFVTRACLRTTRDVRSSRRRRFRPDPDGAAPRHRTGFQRRSRSRRQGNRGQRSDPGVQRGHQQQKPAFMSSRSGPATTPRGLLH